MRLALCLGRGTVKIANFLKLESSLGFLFFEASGTEAILGVTDTTERVPRRINCEMSQPNPTLTQALQKMSQKKSQLLVRTLAAP